MRLLVSWLREFVDVAASPDDIAERLSLRGFEVASVEALGPDDGVIDFEVTANRPDCLSVLGLAREVATVYGLPLSMPAADAGAHIPLAPTPEGPTQPVAVTIEDDELCPRYVAAAASVTVAPSPDWLATRLQAAGVRPISNIVDITNYVLLELGHPMHAFDLATLAGRQIRVRRAAGGESLTTLDAVSRTLEPDMLVIADRDRAQAVAGVMGGAASEVSSGTRQVVFESAYFKPASIRRTGKRLGISTEASMRFERGADIEAPPRALLRAMALMRQIGAGTPAGPVVDVYPRPRGPLTIPLRRERLARVLGARVADADVERILRGLGLFVTATAEGWSVVAPTFRVDLVREIDLVEEVGRHDGFDRLAPSFPVATQPAPLPDPRVPRDQLVRRVLTAAGLSEAVTFGFIEAKAARAFPVAGGGDLVSIANPLSAKFDTLRATLLPGLVDAVAHNRRHGRRDVRLFEIGTRFRSTGESRGVAVAWTGSGHSEHWSGATRDVDFFDVKGVVERLGNALGVAFLFEPSREAFLVPGQTASLRVAATTVGLIGTVAPPVADGRGLPRQDALVVAEIDLDTVERARQLRTDAIEPLPRYPFVVRDLSMVVADSLPAAIIRDTIQAAASHLPAPLVAVTFFDRYRGKGVPEQHASLSVRLTFQAADRTLTDGEVQQTFDTILGALVRAHGATQR